MTLRGRLLAAAAILGAATAAFVVMNQRRSPSPLPVVEPAGSPFRSFVAGTGLVEASTGDIAIGSPVSGVATAIPVRVGDRVRTGDVLFRIDDRDLRAQLLTAHAHVQAAIAELAKPRHRLDFTQHLVEDAPGIVAPQALSDLRDETAAAAANVGLAKAEVARLEQEIDRRVVRAPVSGRVLQLTLRLGEYVQSGGAAPVLLFGDDRTLYVRAQVDENDAWRIRPGARAVASPRGLGIRIPLHFEYIEPNIVPKVSLTGRSTERTDTRVLQILYSFAPEQVPVYVGQQLDVFVEAPPPMAATAGH